MTNGVTNRNVVGVMSRMERRGKKTLDLYDSTFFII